MAYESGVDIIYYITYVFVNKLSCLCVGAYMRMYIHTYLHIPPYLLTLPLPLHFIFTLPLLLPHLTLPYPTLPTYVPMCMHTYIRSYYLFTELPTYVCIIYA